MSLESSPSRLRPVVLGLAALLLVGVLGMLALLFWDRSKPKPDVDMTAVLVANNQGVGWMERFDYPKAIEAFDEVHRLAPDWVPGKINLGIALLNEAGKITPNSDEETKRRKELFDRAIGLFNSILDDAAIDNDWRTSAHYCLGVIYLNLDDQQKALPHLERVTQRDAQDAYGWYKLGLALNFDDPKRAAECFERAMALDPNLGGAVYAWSTNTHVRETQGNKVDQALDEFLRMSKAALYNAEKERYSELGKYCEIIGRIPAKEDAPTGPPPLFRPPTRLTTELASGTRWLKRNELDPLGKELRRRFGATMVLLDFDRDDRLDVLLLNSVMRNEQLGAVLFRNAGEGNFVDVTEKQGLSKAPPAHAVSVGDFDNDGRPDLLLSLANGIRLYRNRPENGFEDVTQVAGLTEAKGFFLGSGMVDIDQDGDLDLVLCRFAADPAEAQLILGGREPGKDSGVLLYRNRGEARPANPTLDPPPLTPSFALQEDAIFAGTPGGATTVAFTDVDLDRDLDVLFLSDWSVPGVVLNNRLLRFASARLPETLFDKSKPQWNGVLVLDVDRDERSDLLLLRDRRMPMLLKHNPTAGKDGPDRWFAAGEVSSMPLVHAQAVDVNLDGHMDVVGFMSGRAPTLLLNENKKLMQRATLLGDETSWPADLLAVSCADLNGDARPDVLGWSESKGLWLANNGDNGTSGVAFRLSGHRRVEVQGGETVRTNADGFGTRVAVQSAGHWTTQEYTTLSAGLGQARLPVQIGLGTQRQAELLRLRWPDNVWQAEFNFAAGQTHRIEQTNRKTTSCPILFAWDGQRYRFITDFLGEGTMGEMTADGGHRKPRAEESVKIEADQLRPREGRFVLKIAEPMDEITYLDSLQLLVLDHPAEQGVYPDERFAAGGPAPTQDLLAHGKPLFPVKAVDHRGRERTSALLARDRRMTDGFARRLWLGLAEEHALQLDFGEALRGLKPEQPLGLFLAGWTDYAYPESLFAAAQAGVAIVAPVLEQQTRSGQWQRIADLGFPAGLPRMMTFELTGKLLADGGPLRIRTNLQVYWDQIYLAPLTERVPAERPTNSRQFRTTSLSVTSAELTARAIMQEFSPDGRLPTVYDYDRLAPMPVTRLTGHLTRYGEVRELLTERDDRLVVFGPGDELDVRFDATQLPTLPAGWVRSYVLRTWGHCKDTGPFTAFGDSVGPLPFRAMSNYPPAPGESPPSTPLYRDYLRRYQTRPAGR